jgi:hypothetical protein
MPSASSRKKAKSKGPARSAKRPAQPAKAPQKRKGPPEPAKAGSRAPAAPPQVAEKGAAQAQAAPAAAKPPKPAAPKRSSRKSALAQRRGPDGRPLQPGDILIPTGVQGEDEIQYLLRGCVAAERPGVDAGIEEILAKRGGSEDARSELKAQADLLAKRFESGSVEPLLPARPPARRNFQGVVERAKHRRREIGAFLRGLDIGRTETSHMDSHGEASLQSLMEWAARLENLAEADEPGQADYAQFHRGLDQLENTTEALIIDVEQTLRRLRDRIRASTS